MLDSHEKDDKEGVEAEMLYGPAGSPSWRSEPNSLKMRWKGWRDDSVGKTIFILFFWRT